MILPESTVVVMKLFVSPW